MSEGQNIAEGDDIYGHDKMGISLGSGLASNLTVAKYEACRV